MRYRAAAMCLFFAALHANACSCAGSMPQLLLDHAQFFAEVVFRADGEYDILRVARGDSTLAGRRLVLPNVRDVVPRSCCEHHPPAVAAGHAYWVASPGQLESRGRRVTLDHPQVF